MKMLDRNKIDEGKGFYLFFKRLQDIVLSLCGLVVLLIPMLIIALIIYIDDPKGSPIFCQKRVGKDGKEFKFYKFRSMVVNAEELLESLMKQNEADGPAFKMKEDPRITKIGKFLRQTSLDELPQLINVLRGDMTIVGPRPPLPREVAQYTDYQKQRLYVTPGLTCYWQISHGRNDIKFEDWLKMDLDYIENRSFLVDWKIIFGTVLAVINKQGE